MGLIGISVDIIIKKSNVPLKPIHCRHSVATLTYFSGYNVEVAYVE